MSGPIKKFGHAISPINQGIGPQNVGIDWSNAITKDLSFALLLNNRTPRDLVAAARFEAWFAAAPLSFQGLPIEINAGVTDDVTPWGPGLKFPAVDTGKLDFGVQQPVIGGGQAQLEFTILVIANPPWSTSQQPTLFSQRQQTGFPQVDIFCNSANGNGMSSGNIELYIQGGLGSSTNTATAVDGNYHVYVGRVYDFGSPGAPGGVASIWVDGNSSIGGSQFASLTSNINIQQKLAIGGIADAAIDSYAANCTIPLVLVWNRGFSNDEIAAISIDPFQVFLPEEIDLPALIVPPGSAVGDAPPLMRPKLFIRPWTMGLHGQMFNAPVVGYSTAIAPGVFALTGVSALLTPARRAVATAAAFALNGIAANLVAAHRFAAVVGAFALTGIAANLTVSRRMTASVATFAINGPVTFLRYARLPFSVSAGAFTLTGVAAGLGAQRRLPAVAGAFALTGVAATLTYTPAGTAHTMTAATGTFTLTGLATGLRHAATAPAVAGAFAVTGVAARLAAGRRAVVTAGSFALNGVAALLRYGRAPMPAASGAFAITGVTAALRHGYTMPAVTATFALTGIAATLRAARTLSVTAGAFALASIGARLAAARRLPAVAGAVNVSGVNANLVYAGTPSHSMTAAPGAFTVTGVNINFVYASVTHHVMLAANGQFHITGWPVILRATSILGGDLGVATPVTTVLYGGTPVMDVTLTAPKTGTPVSEAPPGEGTPVTKVAQGGIPVVYI